jgi:hypothetical protein
MYRGKIVATVDVETATREQLGVLMADVAPGQVQAAWPNEESPTDKSEHGQVQFVIAFVRVLFHPQGIFSCQVI